jgi:ribosomal protein S18 acetylase RimI-like enzyme
MSNTGIELLHVQAGPLLDDIRALFLEYAHSLDFSLCFQNFDEELRTLPGEYGTPRGRLILCRLDGTTAGCIALKPLGGEICEMKRLFVRPEFRGRHVGFALATYIIEEAKRLGYGAMLLDTIASMHRAMALYRSLGFREIPPYYKNPIPNAVYFELDL